MANNPTTRADLDKMVDSVQDNRESASKFLESVNNALDGKEVRDRALEMQYLVSKLEKEGKLPGLIVNAGLGDSQSATFRATTFNGKELRKEDVKNIADSSKNGPLKFDAATQLLFQGLQRKLGDRNTLKSDDIKKWAENETRTGVRVDSNTVKSSIKQFENVLKEFDTPAKLKAAFGSETPDRENIKKAVEQQITKRQTIGSLGGDFKNAEEKGVIWSDSKFSAAQYLLNEDNYNRVQGAKDESWSPISSGDWISADKLKQLGKDTYKTSIEQIDTRDKRRNDVNKEVNDLAAKLDAKLAPDIKANPEGEKLKEENSELQKKIAEQEERLKKLEELLKQPKKTEVPGPKVDTPKDNVAPPPKEKTQEKNWAEEEAKAAEELRKLLEKK